MKIASHASPAARSLMPSGMVHTYKNPMRPRCMLCSIMAMASASTICKGTTTATSMRVFFMAREKFRSPHIFST